MTSPLTPADPVVVGAFAAALGEPGRLRTRAIDRLKMSHDASHYALVPQAVAEPVDAAEVGRLLGAAAAHGIPITFRSGGTSLSGQAGTDGILVDTRKHFRSIEVLDDGMRVRVGPGATVRAVNTRLARHGRKLGPDPASEIACTLGGVVNNNSSGMACGTAANTYNTLDSLVLVLPSGTVLDTGAPDADERLRALEPELYAGLDRLRERVRGNAASVRTLEQQFSMKNTMGYGLNSFLDHTRPVDVLAHLVVGSEGTLAFVASVVMHTVPLLPHAMTGLLVFDDLSAATGSLPAILETAPATIELMDAASLRVGQADPKADEALRRITVDRHAALLVEYQALTAAEVTALGEAALPGLTRLPVSTPAALASDPASRARLWNTRKGLYAAVAGARPSGTTALLEDIVVPVPALLPTCETLIELFARHGYEDPVIFGHAKDGNIHFMLNERLEGGGRMDRLLAFTDDMVSLVLGHEGSLKAEHGTGRIMAPFVRLQYGDELHDVMKEVKRLCDPRGLLNPGVILSDDPDEHTRNIKVAPTVEAEVDRCVECGYCEPVCPSRDLTTTPRQRIVLRREMRAAEQAGNLALLRELEGDYEYDAIDTCAVDGMCQTACPVDINTGDLTKRLRAEAAGPVAGWAWRSAARHWDGTSRAAATALTLARALPDPVVQVPNELARRVGDADVVPPVVGRAARRRAAPARRERGRVADVVRGGARGRVLRRVRRGDVRADRRRPGGARRLRRALPPRRRAARGPARPSRSVLRHAVAVQGHARRGGRDGGPRGAGPVGGDPRRRARGGQRRRLVHRGTGDQPRARGRERQPVYRHPGRRRRCLRGGPRAAAAAGASAGGARRAAPDLLVDRAGDERRAADGGSGRGRRGVRARLVGLLRLRGRPRDAAPRADGVGDRGAVGRDRGCRAVRRVRVVQPHLRAGHDPGDRPPLPARARAAGRRRGMTVG